MPQLRIEADAVELPGERADIGCDRHAVVVEQHHYRSTPAARVLDGLESHSAGHRPIAYDRHHAAVLAVPTAHRLLDPERVPDRGRGVTGAHDVVLGLGDRAERR